MKTYNRPEPEQLLEDYIKAEEYLQIFNRVSHKEMKELREEIKTLKRTREQDIQEHKEQMADIWKMYKKITSPESLRKPLFGSNRGTKKINKILDEREGIKTPKVAEVRKCPTCNQESHDKIGYHYKCLNPDCEIDTFQK